MSAMAESVEISFGVVRANGVRQTLTALITLDSASWEVWATTADSRRFMVKDLRSETNAREIAHAFTGQVREADAVEWARSKGFSALADHMQSLRDPGAGGHQAD